MDGQASHHRDDDIRLSISPNKQNRPGFFEAAGKLDGERGKGRRRASRSHWAVIRSAIIVRIRRR